MTLPSVPRDPNRDRRKRRHFSYEATRANQKWTAYIAGKTWWTWVHGTKRSKPCAAEISGGELSCEYCRQKLAPIVKGYVPLYRESDYKCVCTCLYEEQRDVIDDLPLHVRVIVGRERKESDPIFVMRHLMPTPLFLAPNAECEVTADVTSSVLSLWGDRDLIEWYRVTHGASDNVVSQNKGDSTDDTRCVPGQGSDTAASLGFMLGSSFSAGLPVRDRDEIAKRRNEAFVKDAKKPKTNGKH